MSRNTYFLKRLLSGKRRITIDDKDDVFSKVWSEVNSDRHKADKSGFHMNRPLLWSSIGFMVIIFLGGIYWHTGAQIEDTGTFTAKGGDGSDDGATFMIRCAAHKNNRCDRDDTMGFRVNDAAGPYFAAFSIHEQSKKILWYFPSEESSLSIRVSDESGGGGWMKQAIQLDDTHPSGQYEVFGVSSQRALSRTQIRQLIDHNIQPEQPVHISRVHFHLE